jgi:hypothetical protein
MDTANLGSMIRASALGQAILPPRTAAMLGTDEV